MKSPLFMNQVQDYLRVFKLMLVVFALFLFNVKYKHVRRSMPMLGGERLFYSFSNILAAIQLPLLCTGIFFSTVLSVNLEKIHIERNFQRHNIYVYTADPGAFGKAYHHFYVKCELPFKRYKLIEIATIDWIRDLQFGVTDNTLLINSGYDSEPLQSFDISRSACKRY